MDAIWDAFVAERQAHARAVLAHRAAAAAATAATAAPPGNEAVGTRAETEQDERLPFHISKVVRTLELYERGRKK